MSVVCDRCGRKLKQGEWIYSRFTGKRYCADLKACKERKP